MACNATPNPDLDDLKQRLGVKTNAQDDQLQWCLDVATAWVDDRVYPGPDQQPGERHPEVVEAILLLASRYYSRRNSPEGVAGWGELGVIRVLSQDPDIERLLERHIDYSITGIA